MTFDNKTVASSALDTRNVARVTNNTAVATVALWLKNLHIYTGALEITTSIYFEITICQKREALNNNLIEDKKLLIQNESKERADVTSICVFRGFIRKLTNN